MSLDSRATRRSILRASPRINLALDLVGALLFSALAGTGALLQWRLPHGGGHGRAHAPSWLGLGRHDWGELHFWLAAVAALLILVHVLLHWAWIRAFWPRLIKWGSGPVGLTCILIMSLIVVAPFVVPLDTPNVAKHQLTRSRAMDAHDCGKGEGRAHGGRGRACGQRRHAGSCSAGDASPMKSPFKGGPSSDAASTSLF